MNKSVTQAKSKDRIAIFFAADSGGAQLVMVNIASELAKLDQEVDVVMAQLKGPYIHKLPQSVTTFDLKTRQPHQLVSRFLNYIQDRKPSVILAAQQQTNLVAIIARLFGKISTPLIIHQHNQLSLLAQNDQRILVRVLPFFAKYLYPFADEIVAVSQGVAKDLSEITGLPLAKFKIIYNPVITEEVFTLGEETPTHSWLFNKEKPVILSAGRLTKQKDSPTLIRAFAQVYEQLDCRLIIVGEGEERPHLEQLISELKLDEVVSLPGFTENPYSYMARSNLFVLSSAWEGFGNVLVEAMAFGTPVVSTNCPSGPSEILANGEYGSLVPVGDVSALSAAIQKTLASPLPPEILKDRAKDFTAKTVGEQFLELLQANLTKKT